ncbi:MAG TPA: hypothetical protein P5307_26995, partial [Pirellulaceae bacterium]|nr:hypothetical protein [Pirellulaceae bacterium]
PTPFPLGDRNCFIGTPPICHDDFIRSSLPSRTRSATYQRRFIYGRDDHRNSHANSLLDCRPAHYQKLTEQAATD